MIRRRLWVGIVLALGIGVAACGKPSGADAVKAAEKLADAICACKDLDCAKKAGEAGAHELDKYKGAKRDAKQDDAITAAGERAKGCFAKVSEPAPPPAPEAEGLPPPAADPTPAPTPPATPK